MGKEREEYGIEACAVALASPLLICLFFIILFSFRFFSFLCVLLCYALRPLSLLPRARAPFLEWE